MRQRQRSRSTFSKVEEGSGLRHYDVPRAAQTSPYIYSCSSASPRKKNAAGLHEHPFSAITTSPTTALLPLIVMLVIPSVPVLMSYNA